MNFRFFNWIIAAVVFIISTVVFVISVQPTMSLWDCGEFLACAYTMGVPHPPGAPLHILVGRIFTMLPLAADIGLRMNLLSVLSSSITVLLLYLISVRLIINWRGKPETILDYIIITLPSAIGALSLSFSDSFWFNAMEAEVYGFGTLLLALGIYVLMLWWDTSDKEGSDKILLFVFYISGLALGIHLLVVQVIFIAGLFYYFKRFKFEWKTFFIAVILSMIIFFIFYPGITKKFPSIISSNPAVLGLAIIILLAIFTYYAYKSGRKILTFALLAIFLAIIGYSTYLSVLMRANVPNLPVNNNAPATMERLLSYLNREQYGEQPLFLPRRYSKDPMHERTWQLYSSDMDFMFRYQIYEMYIRYLLWQYVGRAGYNQGDGWDFSKFYAIPFFLGLWGVIYHFYKHKKLAFIFLVMFIMMGVITALYQNQQDPQPRERDYFYIGSFFVFSLWIGLGITGIIEMIIESIQKKLWIPITAVILILGFIFVPFNMYRVNVKYQSRSGNYFPFDYAYNLLQSCEKDAILITNGDNDTFPLWCLQAVYGIRTDVRVVNLSLAQIDWYNLQLKNERPYGAKTVPFTLSDDAIKRLQPIEWDERKEIVLDIPKSAYPDSMQNKPDLPDKLRFKIPATLKFQQGNRTITALKTNDLVVLDIVRANKFERPIYFSVTVTEDNYIGLGEYLMLEGMAQRLYPFKVADPELGVGIDKVKMFRNLVEVAGNVSKTPQDGFRYTGLNDSTIFYEQVQHRMVDGYRMLFLKLAHSYSKDPENIDKVKTVLDAMNTYIPPACIDMDYRFKYDVAMLYAKAGETKLSSYYADLAIEDAKKDLDAYRGGRVSLQAYYNPYRILIDMYELKGDYQSALAILNELNPNDPAVSLKKQNIMNKIAGKVDTTKDSAK